MHKKKFIFFIIIILLLSGCTKITDNLDEVVNATIIDSKLPANTVSTGYELYIPTGVKQVKDRSNNQKFKIKNRYIYLYVDMISYYYKNMLNYKNTNDYDYYYKELTFGDKTGYIGIKQVEDDLYYTVIVYNYSKIEFYSDKEDLKTILANSLIIIKSIKFNDNLIKMELDKNVSDGRELKYELDSPKNTESTFSDYLQEYVPKEETKVELPEDNQWLEVR